eukprot:gb/GECH01012427.1/.p1 GENE.gb/GECH01012427.1/~~gb/GECH01012427.1/.p1  ORF type:complete len:158 (+),score=45.40 gb/GECH01012427.1/:1-474(+)
MHIHYHLTQEFLHKFGFYGEEEEQQSRPSNQPLYTHQVENQPTVLVEDSEVSEPSTTPSETTSPMISFTPTTEPTSPGQLTEELERREDSLTNDVYDKSSELLVKIPKRASVQSPCASLRNEAVSCYNQNRSNVLQCGSIVDRFFNCANKVPSEAEF